MPIDQRRLRPWDPRVRNVKIVGVMRDERPRYFIYFYFFCNSATAVDFGRKQIAAAPQENSRSVSGFGLCKICYLGKCISWKYINAISESRIGTKETAARQTRALLSHAGFLLPDFRKNKVEKNSTTSTLPPLTRWFFDILIQSTTPQQPPGFPWWTEPQVRLIYWGFFIIIMNLFWPFSSIFYEEVRHVIGINIRGEFIQSLRINLLHQIHFTDPASAAWSSRNFISW